MIHRTYLSCLFLAVLVGCKPSSHTPPEKLLEEARRLGNEGQTEESVRLAELAVQAAPKNLEAVKVATLANLLRSRELMKANRRPAADVLFFRAAELARKLQAARPDLDVHEQQLVSNALYNEACAFALAKKPERALKSLKEAFDVGYSYLDNVRVDPDLEIIRETKQFKELMAKAAERLAEQTRRQASKDLEESESFPFSLSLPDLNDKTVSLTDFKGRVVVVDFWGTWCPPCRREIPHFVRLHEEYSPKGLQVLGVNYEDGPREAWREMVVSFVDERGVPYPCLIGDDLVQNQVPDFKVFPTTLFIDRKGKVRLKAEGYHDYEYLQAVVENLLKE